MGEEDCLLGGIQPSGNQVVDHLAMKIGKSEAQATKGIDQSFMVQAE